MTSLSEKAVEEVLSTMFPHQVEFPHDYCTHCHAEAQEIVDAQSTVCSARVRASVFNPSQDCAAFFYGAVARGTPKFPQYKDEPVLYGFASPSAPTEIPGKVTRQIYAAPPLPAFGPVRARKKRLIEQSCFEDREFLDLIRGSVLG
jgi:hypothetical protein